MVPAAQIPIAGSYVLVENFRPGVLARSTSARRGYTPEEIAREGGNGGV
jgi:crotonobetainyl-CoA:carnitine CoA-transferase CaiB-like acyl-CoA transferase